MQIAITLASRIKSLIRQLFNNSIRKFFYWKIQNFVINNASDNVFNFISDLKFALQFEFFLHRSLVGFLLPVLLFHSTLMKVELNQY